MRWLDDRAARRYRRSYQNVLVCRDDARGLLAFFQRSLPYFGEQPRVHASGIHDRLGATWNTNSLVGLDPVSQIEVAAYHAGALGFWVDNEESGKKFLVFVVEDTRGGHDE